MTYNRRNDARQTVSLSQLVVVILAAAISENEDVKNEEKITEEEVGDALIDVSPSK